MPVNDRISILIVDDHPENLIALEGLLDSPDFSIVHATSGNEALSRVLEEDFAVVLMDVHMPEMDGFETASLMRINPQTREIPIIFVTATRGDEMHIFRGYEAGAVDYITKPIEPTILMSKVQVFCRLCLQRRELEKSREALAEAYDELELRNRSLEAELELARAVQEGFIPRIFPVEDRCSFGHDYRFCTVLGGDLFDVFGIGQRYVGAYMADVSGHGVASALISGLLKMAFESFKGGVSGVDVSEDYDLLHPDRIMAHLNRMFFKELSEDTFITGVYSVLDLESLLISSAVAGHPNPILMNPKTGQTSYADFQAGPALSMMDSVVYPLNRIQLKPSDQLVYFTDGVTEAMNKDYDEFGEDRLLNVALENPLLRPPELVASIMSAVDRHRGGHPVSDDACVLSMQIL